jgi:hypothetical protein
MATTELTPRDARRLPCELLRAWLGAYSAIWAATFGASLTVAVVGPLQGPVRDVLGLRLQADRTPAPGLGHVFVLSAHNLPVAAWPVLLGIAGAHRQEVARHLADALMAGCTAVNLLPVGAALGAYGPALLPYIPQLLFEWAALALGASAWLLQRRQALTARQAAALLTLTASVLICAATVETVAVPHEHRHREMDTPTPAISTGGHDGCLLDTRGVPISKELDHEASRHGCPLWTQR